MMLRDGMLNEHQQQAVRVRQKVMRSRLAGQSVSRKYQRAAIRQAEYRRLKAIVPTVADKKSVSKVYKHDYYFDNYRVRSWRSDAINYYITYCQIAELKLLTEN